MKRRKKRNTLARPGGGGGRRPVAREDATLRLDHHQIATNQLPSRSDKRRITISQVLATARSFLSGVMELEPTTARTETVRAISEGVTMRGTGAWMLISSTLLASIGLDMNSPAVIIGAMLISPLMSPIMGVGLSLGIQDRELFNRSSRNLALAVGGALAISTIYFWISPLGEPTEEILARTRPTILDVGVATFGGIAGIVSISRTFASSAIPGVAIATALMPPLCTAGFGLASRRGEIFSGALYLFLINTIFISLATYLTVRYLRFPMVSYIGKAARRKRRLWILLVVALSVGPSLYFLHGIYREIGLRRTIQTQLFPSLEKEKIEVLDWKILTSTNPVSIRIMYAGGTLTDKGIQQYAENLKRAGYDARLQFYKTGVTKEELDRMTARQVDVSVSASGTLLVSEQRMREIDQSLRVFFPELSSVSIGNLQHPVEGGGIRSTPVLVLNRGSNRISAGRRLEIERKSVEYMNTVAGKAAYEILWAE